MQIKIKKHGQTSMEYIMTLGVVMLVFIMVLYVVYEKNMEIIKTKSYLDAQRVTNSIVTNINTISEQGDGYYKYFTIPGELYGGYDYEIIIQGNTVELRWGIFPYTYSKSPITANVHGYVVKDLNKVLNCGGEIYVGFPPISCEEALVNVPPIINIIFPGQGDTLNCSPIIINGNASDVNGTVMEVEVSIDGGLFWNADIANQSNETTWDYSWSPGSDGTHTIRARAIDEYGAYSDIETITVTVEKCSDLIPLGGTFIPSGSVKTGTIQAVSIDVRNDGIGSCGSFKVNIEIKDSGGGTALNYNGTIAGLGAGGTGTVSTTWNFSDVDTYAVTVTVDSGGDVTESNETNNVFSTSVESTTYPPTSNITSHVNNSALDCTPVIIDGTAKDTNDDGWIKKVEVHITGPGGYDETFNAAGDEIWNYLWDPPENGNYAICSIATDNEDHVQWPQSCIDVSVSSCCHLEYIDGSVRTHPQFVIFDINNTRGSAQTIDGMIVIWNVSATLTIVKTSDDGVVWIGSESSPGVVNLTTNIPMDAGEEETIKLKFGIDMENANITVAFILNDSTVCDTFDLFAPEVNITQLNVGRDGWKVYNSTNCTGPSGWTELTYDDLLWTDINLSMDCAGDPGRCNDCDFYFRKHINIPGTPASVGYKFASDDGMWLWVEDTSVANYTNGCHAGGCGWPVGCCDSAENDPTGWKDITSYFNEGDNIVAVHVSERGGYEHLDMIFNITYVA